MENDENITDRKGKRRSTKVPKFLRPQRRRIDPTIVQVDMTPSGILKKTDASKGVPISPETRMVPSLPQLENFNPQIMMKYNTDTDRSSVDSNDDGTPGATSSDTSRQDVEMRYSSSKTTNSLKSQGSATDADDIPGTPGEMEDTTDQDGEEIPFYMEDTSGQETDETRFYLEATDFETDDTPFEMAEPPYAIDEQGMEIEPTSLPVMGPQRLPLEHPESVPEGNTEWFPDSLTYDPSEVSQSEDQSEQESREE